MFVGEKNGVKPLKKLKYMKYNMIQNIHFPPFKYSALSHVFIYLFVCLLVIPKEMRCQRFPIIIFFFVFKHLELFHT